MDRLQKLALYLFFFSINFEVWDPLNTSGVFSVSKLMGFIYLLMMAPRIMKFNTSNENKSVLNPVLLFFILLTLVSLFNINATKSNFFDFSIFQNIILFWILLNHEQSDRLVLEKGMLSFAFGSVALALLYNAGIGIEYSEDRRLTLFGDNENIIGMRMCISMLIFILTVLQNRLNLGKVRYLLLIPIPLMLQLMAESASRTSFLTFVLGFMTVIVLFKTKNSWGKIAIFAAGAVVFFLVFQFLMQSEVLKNRILQSTQEGDFSDRDMIWQRLVPVIKNNPIIGVGITGYAQVAQSIFGRAMSPHNVILEILCFTGITGLFIYLVFLYRIFKKSLNHYRLDGFLLPMILTIPILAMLLTGQILNVKIGWVIFAYIATSTSIINTKEPD